MSNETTTETETPVPGSPEYNEAMASVKREARGETSPTTTEETISPTDEAVDAPTKPEGVPDKFWDAEKGEVNVEALVKSYTELEKSKGEPKDEAEAEAETVEAAPALDFDDLSAKVQSEDGLSDDDFAALESAGIPRNIVEAHVELLKFHQEVQTERAEAYIKEATGEDGASLMAWADKNISEAEKAIYNEQLAGPNWKVAVDTLVMLRGRSKGAGEPNLETGVAAGTQGGVGYASRDEMRADMMNPLYNTQNAEGELFRQQVQAKMANAAWRN